jgi:hypothetical protein
MTGDLTARAEILQLPGPPPWTVALAGMADTLDVEFGKRRRAAAAYGDY